MVLPKEFITLLQNNHNINDIDLVEEHITIDLTEDDDEEFGEGHVLSAFLDVPEIALEDDRISLEVFDEYIDMLEDYDKNEGVDINELERFIELFKKYGDIEDSDIKELEELVDRLKNLPK